MVHGIVSALRDSELAWEITIEKLGGIFVLRGRATGPVVMAR
jgi:hypothetical protein